MRGLDRRHDPADRLSVSERHERLDDVLAQERRTPRVEDHPELFVNWFDPARVDRLRAAPGVDEGRDPRTIIDRNNLQFAHSPGIPARPATPGGAALRIPARSPATEAAMSSRVVLAAQEEPEPREAVGDRRGDDRLNVDAPLGEPLAQRRGPDRVPGHHGHDRFADAGPDVEPRPRGRPRRIAAPSRAGAPTSRARGGRFRARRERRRRPAAAFRRCRRIRPPHVSESRPAPRRRRYSRRRRRASSKACPSRCRSAADRRRNARTRPSPARPRTPSPWASSIMSQA